MYELLSYLSGFDGQMFVSTHSSFVANKLSLNNLIVLGKSSGIIQSQRISDLEDYDFFAKVPNYPTLRVALCDKAILVEGPTDEMVVLYHFMKEYEEQQGVSFLIIFFTHRNKYYYLRFSELKTYMDRVNEGHAKNFKYEELNPDFFIHAKNGALVHYLELLDKDLQLRA